MAFPLTDEQRRCVEHRGGSLLVSAAAGSGKTRVLVERLLSMVTGAERRDIDSFLVITFTNAAAAELRSRILEELNTLISDNPSDAHLRRQSTLIYRANISTIHSLCTSLLREYAHRLDLTPDFRVAEETKCLDLQNRAIDNVLERLYETEAEDSDFYSLVDTMAQGRDDSRLSAIVLSTYKKLQSHPRPEAWMALQSDKLDFAGVGDISETPWGALLMERSRLNLRYHIGRMEGILPQLYGDDKLAKAYAPIFEEDLAALRQLDTAFDGGWDAVNAVKVSFGRLKAVQKCDDISLKERAKTLRDTVKKEVSSIESSFETNSASHLSSMKRVAPVIKALFSLVSEFSAEYSALKRRRGVLDFNDLEHFAIRLLYNGDDSLTETAAELSTRWCEIMVDEYQDVNEVQELIFRALSREGRDLFMVGDVKQSIYRFRLADPGIFLAKYRSYPDENPQEQQDASRMILSRNFRSRAAVLEGVNFIFRNIMSAEFGDMDYTDSEKLCPGTVMPSTDEPCVELDVIEAEDEELSRVESEACFTARRVRELLDHGTITTSAGVRPVRPSDIVILMRSPGSSGNKFAQALSVLGIPVSAAASGGFFSAPEVSVICSLLAIIDNPMQDVPLISVLRSPLYGFTADKLAEIHLRAPNSDFYTALKVSTDDADCAAFLEYLSDLRLRSADMSSDALIRAVYMETGALGIYSAMSEGQTRRENLIALYDYARRYEASGFKGLFAFTSHLRSMMERGEEPAVSGGVSGSGAVSIMSIHKSKGLEFPIVILADCSKQFNRRDLTEPLLVHTELGVGPKLSDAERRLEYPTVARLAIAQKLDDEMLSEELRVLYVALTRAQEKLIMVCSYKKADEALSRLASNAELPVAPAVLRKARSMSDWIVTAALCRPDARPLRERLAEPCAFDPDIPEEWDVRFISDPVEGSLGAVQNKSPAADIEPDAELAAEISSFLDFSYPYKNSVDLPSKLTATELKGSCNAEDSNGAAQLISRLDRSFERPRFVTEHEKSLSPTERGTAFHLALQHLDFTRCTSIRDIKSQLASLVSRGLMTAEQSESVNCYKILAFLSRGIGAELGRQRNPNREFRFSLLMPASELVEGGGDDRVLVQGAIDCWYDTPEGIVIVDFKTDRVSAEEAPARAEHYRPQLELYARALERIMHRPVVKKVLYFFSSELEYEL